MTIYPHRMLGENFEMAVFSIWPYSNGVLRIFH